MAIRYEDECVSCPSEMGCLGISCPKRNVKHYICDECGEEIDVLYYLYGAELCADCVLETLDTVD